MEQCHHCFFLGSTHTTTSQGFTSANDGWALPQPFSNDVGIHNTYFSELHEGIRNRWDPVLVMQTIGILWSPVVPSISRRLAVNPFQFLDIISEYTRDCVATPEDHIRAVCTYRLHSSRIMFTLSDILSSPPVAKKFVRTSWWYREEDDTQEFSPDRWSLTDPRLSIHLVVGIIYSQCLF